MQCNNQSGYEIYSEQYNDYCAGPIYQPIQCCYCYNHIYPTFIKEEIIRIHNNRRNNNNIINNNNNSSTGSSSILLLNWESHIQFFVIQHWFYGDCFQRELVVLAQVY